MTKLKREPEGFANETYDMIIVGGGIYGVMLSYEAVRRNLRPLMLEKNDFSNATSLNHLRTVHGGLRYLQSMDIPRFIESIGERKWFLRYLPQYVTPMPCLMPLYGRGLHRNFILKIALMINDVLSMGRNKGVSRERHLPAGHIISPQQTKELFPMVNSEGLTGSAVWYDGSIQEFQRLLMQVITASAASGASFLNYMEVNELLTANGSVSGVGARDTESGKTFQFHAPVVINAAGPWSRDVAQLFHKDHEPLFKKRLLLWNVLFNKEALSQYALGLTPDRGKGRSYFFHPWKNRLLVGTGELVVKKSDTETQVPPDEMDDFIRTVNQMVPGLNATRDDIERVYSGILPATESGTLSGREQILNHADSGGPKGLYSVSGVKFTTSRLVAEKVMKKIYRCPPDIPHHQLLERGVNGPLGFGYDWIPQSKEDFQQLQQIIDNESVVHLSDLVLRRTSLGDHPDRAIAILSQLKPLFPWATDEQKWQQEVDALKKELKSTQY